MTTESQTIIDNGDLRRYRTELPNMCDDDLDPYQYRLYAHYKRWCGANGGTVTESVRRTADACRMSATKVIETREWLSANGWITIDQNPETGIYAIQIIDRWPENFARFAPQGVLNLERYESRSVPNMEHPVPNMEHTRSKYGTHKKELYMKEPIERTGEGAATPPQPPPTPQPEEVAFWETPEPETPAAPPTPRPTVRSMADQPAIAMYRDAFLRTPGKPQMALILENVNDLRVWRDVLSMWVGQTWKPTNVAGMIDLYQHPERINANTRRADDESAGHRSGSDRQRNRADSRPAWANYNPEPYDEAFARDLGQL